MSRLLTAPPAAGSVFRSLAGRLSFGRYGRNVLSNAGSNAFNSLLQLGLLCFLFQHLSNTVYAAFLLATFLVGLLEMASDYGTRIWATRAFATDADARRVLIRSLQSKACFTALSGLVFSLVPTNTLPSSAYWLCVLIAATQPGSDPLLWFLRGRERLDLEAAVVLACRTATAIGILIAAAIAPDLQVFLTIWLLGNLSRLLVEWNLAAVRSLHQPAVGHSDAVSGFSHVLRAAFPIGTAFVLTSLFQRASVFLLEVFATPEDIKSYGTAFRLVCTSGFVATSICVSSFAMLARAVESGDRRHQADIIGRKLRLVTFVFLPAAVAGSVFVQPAAAYLNSPQVMDVAMVVTLLMPGLYISCINMGLKYTLNAYALNWQDVLAVLIGLSVLTAGTLWVGFGSWETAAAVGWVSGEFSLLICRVLLLKRHDRHHGLPLALIATSIFVLCGLAYFSAN